MFYIPNFCCQCGEKIERPNPSFKDSRKFCDVCQHDFVLQRILPIIFIVLMAFLGVFGIGSYWRGGEKPLNISTKQLAANSSNAGNPAANRASQVNGNANRQQLTTANNLPVNTQNTLPIRNLTNKPPAQQTGTVSPAAAQTVYFCGALTKKGTPCSRRVKGGGRCWQHKGQDALFPPEILIANQ